MNATIVEFHFIIAHAFALCSIQLAYHASADLVRKNTANIRKLR